MPYDNVAGGPPLSLADRMDNSAEPASAELLGRWRDHSDQQAAEELLGRYANRLTALARRWLVGKVRRRIDPEDVVQSACRSFFVRIRDGRLVFEPGDDLWRLLAAITMKKLLGQMEYHMAERRSIAREESAWETSTLGRMAVEPQATGLRPEEEAAINEIMQQVLDGFAPEHRRMAELRLQGVSNREIAHAVGYSDRMVRLVLQRFQTRLERRLRESAEL